MPLTYAATVVEQGQNTISYIVAVTDTTGANHLEFVHGLGFDPTWVEVIPLVMHTQAGESNPATILAEIVGTGVPGNWTLSYRYQAPGNPRSIWLYKPTLANETTYIKIHLGRSHSTPT